VTLSKQLAVLVFSLTLGYYLGRSTIVRDAHAAMAAAVAKRSTIPPGLPDAPESETFDQVDRMLMNELERQHKQSANWYLDFQNAPPTKESKLQAPIRRELQRLIENMEFPPTALNPEQTPWFTRDGVEISIISFNTFPDVRLSCLLLKPVSARPLPAVIALHGVGGSLRKLLEDTDYHHGFALDLARAGFIVLAPVRIGSTLLSGLHLNTKALALGGSLDAIEMRQLHSAIDYLASLDTVDPAHIGVYGISLGGNHALKIGALDERLSLVVVSGYVNNRFSRTFGVDPTFRGNHTPSERDYGRAFLVHPMMSFLLHDANLAALIYPRFLGIESGTVDRDRERDSVEFATVQGVYARRGRPDRCAVLSFAGTHETSVRTTMPFLKRWAGTPSPK